MGSLLRQESVGLLLGAAVREIKRMVIARVASLGLPPRQFWVLVAVLELDSPSLGALASRLRIDEPTASRVIAALARRGLVRVAPDPSDRRRTRILSTPKSRALRGALFGLAEEMRARVVAGLDARHVEALRAGLRHVIVNAQRTTAEVSRARSDGARRTKGGRR